MAVLEESTLDLKLSDRVQLIKPSPTLAVTNRAAELRAEGKDIIGLGADYWVTLVHKAAERVQSNV